MVMVLTEQYSKQLDVPNGTGQVCSETIWDHDQFSTSKLTRQNSQCAKMWNSQHNLCKQNQYVLKYEILLADNASEFAIDFGNRLGDSCDNNPCLTLPLTRQNNQQASTSSSLIHTIYYKTTKQKCYFQNIQLNET